MHRVVAAFALLVSLPNLASAVLISTGNGTGNVTGPATTNPYFNNVVSTWVRTGSAVYLGNGWMLTDNHVGAGTTMINGVFYDVLPGSEHQLKNPTGATFTDDSDVLLYRINATPNLPTIPIGASVPRSGDNVVMIGNGRDRLPNLIGWTGAWSPIDPPAAYTGYLWSTTNQVRWGTNVIEAVGFPQGSGNTSNVVFSTNFSATNATPYEAVGTPGDSGGGVFSYNTTAGRWELIGLMVSYTKFSGQPWGISVFGNSTYAIQLSVYRNQILSYITPGDVTGDGKVDIADLSIVATNWQTTKIDGDANHDGRVDIGDVGYIALNWGAPPGIQAVPEPQTCALAISALLAAAPFALRRFTRRR